MYFSALTNTEWRADAVYQDTGLCDLQNDEARLLLIQVLFHTWMSLHSTAGNNRGLLSYDDLVVTYVARHDLTSGWEDIRMNTPS